MRTFGYFILLLGLLSCQGPEPRRPVKQNTGSSFKASIERTRALLAKEEQLIQDIMAKDSVHNYIQSTTGSWYYYNVKDEASTKTVGPADKVTLTYNVVTFADDTIYRMKDIGIRQFRADKLDLFPGLRNSVPLLKENETATFLFPSSLAYGYHGDDNKIGTNVPLKSTLTLLKIEKQQDSIQN
ncbi:MAG: gliding motility-associated peptidyl-prolyl isomerase GldI [Maribacter sp.]|uniref:gliding motility-associated peptidyl-prolyl isomerase GldI n=1 Tax=Maribacter sp. 2307UL18-2 TaxID=3386274 RepID=UPI0039BCBB75